MKIHDITNEEACKYGRYYCSTDKKWKCRQAPKQNRDVSEMDKSGPQPGRDGHVSHSTYGSRDKGSVSGGKEGTGKPLTAKQMMDRAHKAMMKSMSNAEKVDKGWRNPNLKESNTIDFIRGLISEFNTQMSGSPYYPMDYKNPGMRMWTRGDGSRYKDPGYIFIERDLKPEDQPKWHKAKAVEKFWKFLASKGAKTIGDVSGEFGSDPHSPAVVLNKQVFVFNGRSIAWGSTSRLKNSSVWRQKQQGVAEGYEPGDKITWYHSNHFPEIEGTVEGWKDGHLIVKSIDPQPRNTEKTVARYRVPKNNILSHTKQGVAEAHPNSKIYDKCWDGYKKVPGKKRGEEGSCVKEELEETYDGNDFFEAYGELWYNEDEQLDEAEYRGRKVQLGKPMQGDVKKFKVYVKDPSTGNVKKVNFGDPDMKIRKSNPAARRSFRARHNCDNPGPRTKARFWSCRKW